MSQHSDDQTAGASRSPPVAASPNAVTVGGIVTVASIFVLFLIFAFGLSSLHYCINFCYRRRGGFLPGSPSVRGRRRRGSGATRTRGVDPELLRSLPVTVYRANKGAADSEGDDAAEVECAVCLAELQDGEAARFLPRCGHGFHAACVDKWLASHTTCPLCRLTVAKPDAPPVLAPVPPEPANYAGSANLPATVLLGLSDQQRAGTGAATLTNRVSLVIEIPEPAAAPATGDKSPGSARLRSIRRLWSFGRQGAAGPSCSSCSCAGGSERADVVEQGISVTIDIAVAEAQRPSAAAAGAAVPGASA